MALAPGTRFGGYEITAFIGEGGMGQVYRAIDTKLKRPVALKTLPPALVTDVDRLARFQREAEVLASLNHPNIAAIFGIEEAPAEDGSATRALVMELVEGEDLSRKLQSVEGRGLPLDEAIPIARQIADALDAAHEKGIVHRDLKPANIKVTSAGKVKVLDFGLAKTLDGRAGGPGTSADERLSMSPTIAVHATGIGMILGTAAYMSPEQARGKPADRRSDIWAFGCVLFEMLAGRRVFDPGETVSDAVAAILTRDPDWTALPADLPPSLRTLLRRCLQRDPDRRLHHIADAKLDLEDAISRPADSAASRAPSSSSTVSIASTPSSSSTGRWLRAVPWGVATLALVAAAAAFWGRSGNRAAEASRVVRLEVGLPAGVELFTTTSARSVAISPDSQSIAFIGVLGSSRLVYVRRLDRFDAVPLRGSDNAVSCLFSPDGKSIAFVTAGSQLKTVSLDNGQVATLSDGVNAIYGAAWLADDTLVFSQASALWRIARSGGSAKQLTTLDGPRHDTLHAWPTALPDGSQILFSAESGDQWRVEALNLTTGDRTTVVEPGVLPQYVSGGHLMFYRNGDLLTAPFDLSSLKVTGPLESVVSSLPSVPPGVPVLDISRTGDFVYAPSVSVGRLVWVSQDGAEQPAIDALRPYNSPRLAPDGNRVVVQAGDLWIQDLARATFTRIPAKNPAPSAFPVWTPDGQRILYRSADGLRMEAADGSGKNELLPGTTYFDYATAITPDGESLAMIRNSPETSFDIYSLPLRDPTKVQTILRTPAYEAGPRLSPDGRWLTYVSDESGQYEVYLRPFPGPERRWQVSISGGSQATWNPNGREIFYREGNKMMAVSISTVPDVKLAPARQLFEQRYAWGSGSTLPNYDLSPDGQRFLMVKEESNAARLNIVLNLFADPARSQQP